MVRFSAFFPKIGGKGFLVHLGRLGGRGGGLNLSALVVVLPGRGLPWSTIYIYIIVLHGSTLFEAKILCKFLKSTPLLSMVFSENYDTPIL